MSNQNYRVFVKVDVNKRASLERRVFNIPDTFHGWIFVESQTPNDAKFLVNSAIESGHLNADCFSPIVWDNDDPYLFSANRVQCVPNSFKTTKRVERLVGLNSIF